MTAATTAVSNFASISTSASEASHPLRVLKVGACPSLSGRSTLTYQVACTSDAAVMLRVSANTGSGYFSKEWVPFAGIDALLVADKPLTFSTLQPLFAGKSVNTGGFLMATLKGLGLIRPMESNPRCHQRGDLDAFLAEVQELMAGSVSLGENARPDGHKGKRKTIVMPKTQ